MSALSPVSCSCMSNDQVPNKYKLWNEGFYYLKKARNKINPFFKEENTLCKSGERVKKSSQYINVILSQALERIEESVCRQRLKGQCVTVTATYWLMKECVCVCVLGMLNVSVWPFDRLILSWKMWCQQITDCWLLPHPPPPFCSSQLCCLSGHTAHHLSLW